jgi:hypothetical protein
MSTEHEHVHQKHNNTHYKIIGFGVLILVIFTVVYFTRAYPVALVGSHFVSTHELESSIVIAKKLETNPDKEKVYQQLMDNTKKQQLAGKVDLDAELKFYKTGRSEEYNSFLADYFNNSEKDFVRYVVAPRAYDAKLAIKYNSDYGANNDAYNKAENIINRLNQGQAFDELAKVYSDDKISGQLNGDLGFVTEGQLLPELEKAIKSSAIGEVKKQIIVSRLGYHIIYPIEVAQKDGQKVWHVKHILITTSGYDKWIADQLNSVKVYPLFNF